MTTRVKVCGITRAEDAEIAVALGASAIGLNFWPGSPRCVTVAQALDVARVALPFVAVVGVFVNQPRAELDRVAREVPLSILQLHGDETPADCAGFDRPVMKAVRVRDADSLTGLSSFDVAALLLDAHTPGYGGGGARFDWELVQSLSVSPRIVLAGGLDADNVAEAVKAVRPHAVDVASGVESAPGVKDARKLEAFMAAVKES